MDFLSKLDKFIIRISGILVVLAIFALPVASFFYEYRVIPGSYPAGTKVFSVTAVGGQRGIWTLGKVSGLNYWRKNGAKPIDQIEVEKGDKIVLRINSADVYHGFGLRFGGERINEKITPGQITVIELTADESGHYRFVCTILCGEAHTRMRAEICSDCIIEEEDEKVGA